MMIDNPAILTVKEAAQYLKLSVPTLNRYRIVGDGPRYAQVCVGGAVRYRRVDLDEFVASKLLSSTSEAA